MQVKIERLKKPVCKRNSLLASGFWRRAWNLLTLKNSVNVSQALIAAQYYDKSRKKHAFEMECLQCKASTSLEWKCTRMFMVEYVRACIGQQFLHRNFVVCCVNIYCVILVCSFIPKSHFSRPELYQSLFSSSIEIALKLGKRKSWKVNVFALKN